MDKTIPNFLFPTNFRNTKNIKRLIKDLNIQGYGVAIYLLETLAETQGHKYPMSDIDLLADEMKVSIPIINTVINSYELFELIEDDKGILFFSSQLNQWLEPYYRRIEQRKIAGKISLEKRKIRHEQQLLKLSQLDSTERPLNDRSTNKEIDKKYSFFSSKNTTENDEIEKLEILKEKMLDYQISKDKRNSKLEDLAQASKENQVYE